MVVSLFCLYFVYFASEYKPSCCEIPVYLTFDLFYFEGFSRSKSQEQVWYAKNDTFVYVCVLKCIYVHYIHVRVCKDQKRNQIP